MSDAIREMAKAYGANVEIVPGEHKETKLSASVAHLRADVLTLDGKKV